MEDYGCLLNTGYIDTGIRQVEQDPGENPNHGGGMVSSQAWDYEHGTCCR